MRNYLNRKNKIDTKIFRKYIPDRIKDTKILVNIFVDGSGSMDGRDRWGKALDSLWIINESLNKDKNKVMAYQFSHNYKRFKDYDKPLTIPRMIGGGTHPAPAIKDAFPIIEKYKKTNGFKNVIDIIITDGSFDNNESDKMIDKLNNAGHETILIDVGYQYISKQEMIAKKMNHNAKHLINISNFNDLVPELIEIFGKVKKALVMRAKVN